MRRLSLADRVPQQLNKFGCEIVSRTQHPCHLNGPDCSHWRVCRASRASSGTDGPESGFVHRQATSQSDIITLAKIPGYLLGSQVPMAFVMKAYPQPHLILHGNKTFTTSKSFVAHHSCVLLGETIVTWWSIATSWRLLPMNWPDWPVLERRSMGAVWSKGTMLSGRYKRSLDLLDEFQSSDLRSSCCILLCF